MGVEFQFTSTGIGSVPFLDVEGTCKAILEVFPEIPFWPQFVRRSPFVDLLIHASLGVPLIKLIA